MGPRRGAWLGATRTRERRPHRKTSDGRGVGSAVPGTENPMVRLSGGALPPATPTPHDHAALLDRYYRERDARDREALVQRYLPLARHLSRRYFTAGEREDLEQVASLGLLKAIDRYDPTRGIAFTSFAVPTILGELKRYFRDFGWSVRVPRSLQELAAKVDGATSRCSPDPAVRPPSRNSRAASTPTPRASWRPASSRRHITPPHSTWPLADDSDATLIDTLATDDDGYQSAEDTADLDRLLAALPGPRTHHPSPAVPRRHDPAGDLPARRPLADARLTAHQRRDRRAQPARVRRPARDGAR